jgi:GcrA cell cycle regulator
VNKFTGHTVRRRHTWTPARHDELIALYTAASQPNDRTIAEAMGLRASQIHGRLDRLRAAGVLSPRPREATVARQVAAPATADEWRTALQPHANDVWPVGKLVALCLGWIAGEKTFALAARLQVSKNAAVGKVHRLVAKGVLAGRPSPIRGGSPTAARRAASKRARSESVAAARCESLGESGRESGAATRAAPRPPPLPAPRFGRVTECCWPIGTPGTRGFRFCDAPTEPGRPYCEEHARIAYTRLRVPESGDGGGARPGP